MPALPLTLQNPSFNLIVIQYIMLISLLFYHILKRISSMNQGSTDSFIEFSFIRNFMHCFVMGFLK